MDPRHSAATTIRDLSSTGRPERLHLAHPHDPIALADGVGWQTATVTFKTHRAAKKFRSQRQWPTCLGRQPRIDTDSLGLTVLASSAADDVGFASPPPSPCSNLPL